MDLHTNIKRVLLDLDNITEDIDLLFETLYNKLEHHDISELYGTFLKVIDDNYDELFNYSDSDTESKDNYDTDDEIKNDLSSKVKKLMKLPQPEQRSTEWYELRRGMMTASTDIRNALGLNKYDKNSVTTLILKKCGYEENPFTGNIYTEWGIKYEPIATQLYEFRNKEQVIEFGLIQHPIHKFIGASPDGITPKGIMLEIKCPYRRQITGIVPDYYWIQMQTQLEVCDLDVCDFLECNFCEYETKECFYEDTCSGDDRKTSDGMEKGVFVEFVDRDGNKSYIYPSYELSTVNKLKWLEDEVKKASPLLTVNYIYWSLSLYSCVKVERNKKWWNEQVPKLKEVWDKIEYHRKHGYDDLLQSLKTSKTKRSQKTVVTISFDTERKQDDCLFSDTDEEN